MSTDQKPNKPTGRPRLHDRVAIAATLFRVMARGGTLKSACDAVNAETGAKLKPEHIIRWAATDATFRESYSRAREQQAHAWADEMLTIAEEPVGYKDLAAAARNRLRIDTRKWLCSKIVPRLYGTREDLELDGPKGAPIAVRVVFTSETRRSLASMPDGLAPALPAPPPDTDTLALLPDVTDDDLWGDTSSAAPMGEGSGPAPRGGPAGDHPSATPSDAVEDEPL